MVGVAMSGLAARYCMNLRRATRECMGPPGNGGSAPMCRGLRKLSSRRLRHHWRKLECFGDRQVNRERTALARCASHVDRATEVRDDRVYERKSEPGAAAGFLGRETRLEDALQRRVVHAASVVLDAHPDPLARPYAAMRQRTLFAQVPRLDRDA